MSLYPFDLLKSSKNGSTVDPSLLLQRPFTEIERSFQADARRFIPGDQLSTAINTAIAVGEPLLITGEPGTGKTQAAYYTAYRLGIEPVIHFQVKSDSTAHDLLYHFDAVRYFHDAHLARLEGTPSANGRSLDKQSYVEKRELWRAFERAKEQGLPQVLLIDEIDKAPRDFPNDLLHELDKMEFTVAETGLPVSSPPKLAPIVFITSNSERRLPEPFLRRCVYHHIRFDDQLVEQAVFSRRQDEFAALSDGFLRMALRRFLELRQRALRKLPATAELLVWLRVLALASGAQTDNWGDDPDALGRELSELPYLGVLLKDQRDIDEIRNTGY